MLGSSKIAPQIWHSSCTQVAWEPSAHEHISPPTMRNHVAGGSEKQSATCSFAPGNIAEEATPNTRMLRVFRQGFGACAIQFNDSLLLYCKEFISEAARVHSMRDVVKNIQAD